MNALAEYGQYTSAQLSSQTELIELEIKQTINQHHSQLLLHAGSIPALSNHLHELRHGLAEVDNTVQRLKRKISLPHTQLKSSLTLLTRLRRASSLVRRSSRFTVLARRLEGQMVMVDSEIEIDDRLSLPFSRASVSGQDMRPRGSLGGDGINLRASISTEAGATEGRGQGRRERAMAEAALTLAEIESLLEFVPEQTEPDDSEALLPIRDLHPVAHYIPLVTASRLRVVEEMETMIHRGLDNLDNPLLASSLQTAHNLSVLPSLVERLMREMLDLVDRCVKECFDIPSLAREISAKDGTASSSSAFVYKSRARNEPTSVTLPQWSAAMWLRLEELLAKLGAHCIKIYTLEKVLLLKRDQNTQSTFLEEALRLLDNRPSLMFWTTLSKALEVQAKDAVRSSSFMQTLLSTGYPRLLRLFQEFFSTIAVHTDTVYTQSTQSPETILVLRAILPFETLYLTRSANRLNECVTSSFSLTSSLAASFTSSRSATVPTANEGLAAARAIVNELDAARFDPLLARAIAKGAARAIEMFVAKSEGLITTDHGSTSLTGPLATPSQHTNADLTSALYHLWLPLYRALPDHTESVREVLRPSVENTKTTYASISSPLIMAIRRELSSIITRMHRVDYSDASAGAMMGAGGASNYMNDLTEKLTVVREEILGIYKVGDLAKEWALDLARFTVQTYVLHASIVKPLSESGKLKLTSDTTSLEFAISAYLSSHSLALSSMGDQFKALRAFRPLLFLDTEELGDVNHTADVPVLILLHHILSRSSLPLPHQAHGWTEGEYVRWLNEHGEEERIKLVEEVLSNWEDRKKRKGESVEDEYVVILRAIIRRQTRE